MSLRSIVKRVFSRGGTQRDADLDDEVRTHLELLAAEYERRGLSADEARFATPA